MLYEINFSNGYVYFNFSGPDNKLSMRKRSDAEDLVALAKNLSKDPAALEEVALHRTTCSYKSNEGNGLTYSQRVLALMKKVPFSLNCDEATSKTNKKILTILASLINPDTWLPEVQPVQSTEVRDLIDRFVLKLKS